VIENEVLYRVEILKSAEKTLDKIPEKISSKIIEIIKTLRYAPRPYGCIKLVGIDKTYRIRVGDYRIVYEIHDGVLLVMVISVDHRKDVYR
jgi:mRNA interferase RelE/StbE